MNVSFHDLDFGVFGVMDFFDFCPQFLLLMMSKYSWDLLAIVGKRNICSLAVCIEKRFLKLLVNYISSAVFSCFGYVGS